MKDSLTYYVYLKKEELLQGFDYFFFHVKVYFLCMTYYVLVLFVGGGWYTSCSDTRSLFTQHSPRDNE